MEQFKRAVRKFNIQIGRSIIFSRVEPLKCKTICCEANCPWSIYCSRSNEPRSFQVKTFVNQHVCARSHTNKSADRKWVIEQLEEKLRDQRDFKTSEAEAWFRREFNGLIPAMEQVMPGVHHRFCAMHIWANFTKRWKDKQLKGAVWEYCRATTVTEFEAAMMRLKGINNAAWQYLDRLDPKTWTKAHFSEWPKVDNVTNNNCETFNGKILKYRGKPIITMLEEVRVHVMRVMARNKKSLSGYVGTVAPR
ncbi:uncharacterized protein [Arachis hypogaea]|uniref:uncharacterized protein n=1 Tax=Arachis hypogaea TaxID=3818 RepID=UPI000DEC99A8|nr:uncharacterized protein LOC112805460 [Arachis hypogaea]